MLGKIKLHNFKAFEDLELELAPITLLLGPNNSGKSSIIAPLRLLIQTLESNDNSVPLLLNGIMGDFGTYKDIVYKNHRGRQIEVKLTIYPGDQILTRKTIPQEGYSDRTKESSIEISLNYKYRSKRREIILKRSELTFNGKSLLVTDYSEDSERQLVSKIEDTTVPSSLKSTIARNLRMENFIPRLMRVYGSKDKTATTGVFLDDVDNALYIANKVSFSLRKAIQTIEYLGAMRIPPSRTYLFTGERRRRIGPAGEQAANILAMDTARAGTRSKQIINAISQWLTKADVASDVKVETISDRHYEIRVQHPITHEYQNISDVGYGNSQILPVLIGGYNLQRGATYIIEEPEIHLHPRAQSELGEFFLDLYNEGIQSIVETHSEYVVLKLQQYIANHIIPPNHVLVYYVYADEDKKKVVPLRLNDKGNFIDQWPEGFFPERLNEAKTLSRIRYEKEFEEGF